MIDLIIDEKRRLWSRLDGGKPISLADVMANISPGTDSQFRLFVVRSTAGSKLEPLPIRAGTTTAEIIAIIPKIRGEISATIGGDTCIATGENLQELAVSLQGGLNSLTTVHNAGGVKVNVAGWRGLDIRYELVGAQTAPTVNVSALEPNPDGTVTTPITGTASVRQLDRILLGEKTLATLNSWSVVSERDSYEYTQAGDAGSAAIYEISLADPAPAAGSFSLDLGGTKTDPIPPHYGAKNMQTVIDSAWGEDLFTVRKPYPYTWRIQRSALGALTLPTADVTGIVWHPGASQSIDLSTLAEYAQTAGPNLHLRLIVRSDLADTGDAEIYREDCVIPAEKLEI